MREPAKLIQGGSTPSGTFTQQLLEISSKESGEIQAEDTAKVSFKVARLEAKRSQTSQCKH